MIQLYVWLKVCGHAVTLVTPTSSDPKSLFPYHLNQSLITSTKYEIVIYPVAHRYCRKNWLRCLRPPVDPRVSLWLTSIFLYSVLIEERIENKILPVWPDKLQPAGNAMMWNSHSILFILFMYVLENTLFNKLAWKVRWIPSAAPAKCILLKGGWKKKSMDLKW